MYQDLLLQDLLCLLDYLILFLACQVTIALRYLDQLVLARLLSQVYRLLKNHQVLFRAHQILLRVLCRPLLVNHQRTRQLFLLPHFQNLLLSLAQYLGM